MTDRQFKQSVAILRSSCFCEGNEVKVNPKDKDYFGRSYYAVYISSVGNAGFTGLTLSSICNCFGVENIVVIDSHFVKVCVYIEESK